MAHLEYRPSRVTPPGATLSDLLEERGITQTELSLRLHRSQKHVSEVIRGKASLTPELALDLERVLGTPAQFWLVREAQYQEYLHRANRPEPSKEDKDWAKSFPYSEMAKRGWVPVARGSGEKFHQLLQFFGVVSRVAYAKKLDNLTLQFRKSARVSSKNQAIAAWLRQGEIEAERVEVNPYQPEAFEHAVRAARGLTSTAPCEFIPKLKELFANAGVVLLFVPELPGMGVSGATRWLTPTKALIQVTLRFRTDDHLWFTIFHESCHILKHLKRGVYLEVKGNDDQEEREANEFAADTLIPRDEFDTFVQRRSFDSEAVAAFAARLNLAPGIVVGRLQHAGLLDWVTPLNKLKVAFKWNRSGETDPVP